MIVLYTDFSLHGPYVGQMKAAILRQCPGATIIDLMHDAPCYKPQAAGYLLARLVSEFPKECVFVCVVDPGVGTEERKPVMLQLDGQWFVGPDNGLFDPLFSLADKAQSIQRYEILWRPDNLSSSFHGRDLFAPVAAALSMGQRLEHKILAEARELLDADCYEVIYFDGYGNAITGIRACELNKQAGIAIDGQAFQFAQTFAMVPEGNGFWYENSMGLVEVAVNQASAKEQFHLTLGSKVQVL